MDVRMLFYICVIASVKSCYHQGLNWEGSAMRIWKSGAMEQCRIGDSCLYERLTWHGGEPWEAEVAFALLGLKCHH